MPFVSGAADASRNRSVSALGCRHRHQIPDICPENPRDALPSITPVRRSMAATSSGHEDWRRCHEVDLRRLRQRGLRRGRIRGEGRLGGPGARRPLLRAEGRCGRRHVLPGALGTGARRGVSHGNAGDETVLVAVISAYEEGSASMSELSVGAAEFATMRRGPALPRVPRRRGRDTPRRDLHRRDGRAPGEALPLHSRLAVGGEQGMA